MEMLIHFAIIKVIGIALGSLIGVSIGIAIAIKANNAKDQAARIRASFKK